MNKIIIAMSALFLVSSVFAKSNLHIKESTNPTILPNPFPIYTNGSTVINHPFPGFVQRLLPTKNHYKKNPGCYIICYSHQPKNAIYSVGNNIYVMGQIRVPGTYQNRICIPTNYSGKDIKDLCNNEIKNCQDCWGGGDSGGWFGIQ